MMNIKTENNPCRKCKQYETIILSEKSWFAMCFAYRHNLVKVYMECDYTRLNHNQQKPDHKNGGLLYIHSITLQNTQKSSQRHCTMLHF
jgi:hypothetical protein